MQLFPRSVLVKLKELRGNTAVQGLRSDFNALKGGFLNRPTTPILRETKIDRDYVRGLYYNTKTELSNGAFFAASIIDGTADFINLPEVTFEGDAVLTALVNNWVLNFWGNKFWEIYRNALRDTNVWVRLRLPYPTPLLSIEEENVPTLEIIDGDRVQPYYNPVTGELIRVEIDTPVFIEEQPWNPNYIQATGARVYGREHDIREIITKDGFFYYDVTMGQYLDEFTTQNDWGFVPLVEIFNDYDSALHGGKSDLEQVFPFFKALHELIVQTRTIHSYHADPKVKFKLDDVINFLRNNWPDSFVNGEFTGKVSWRDRDVFFMESSEDATFLEATLKIADSVALAEFLIDCICIAAEVTEGILFRAKATQATTQGDEFFRFKRKIDRKRKNFGEGLQLVIRMATKIATKTAHRPKLSWPPIDLADLAAEGQALNQITTAAEVANRAGIISKQTYGSRVRRFYPGMQDHTAEQTQINSEVQAEQQIQLDFEKRMLAINPPANNGGGAGLNGNKNGRSRFPIDILPTSPGN